MTFVARYPGKCSNCFRPIEAGQEVAYVDDELVHVQVCEAATEAKPTKFQGTSLDEMGY